MLHDTTTSHPPRGGSRSGDGIEAFVTTTASPSSSPPPASALDTLPETPPPASSSRSDASAISI
eukprot:363687-Chlamydomonas_euryale.AAC.3